MRPDLTKVIIAAGENSMHDAEKELVQYFPNASFCALTSGVFICGIPGSFADFSKQVRKNNICFTRHIFPILAEDTLTGGTEDAETVLRNFDAIKSAIAGKQIAVHATILDGKTAGYTKIELILPLLKSLTDDGFILSPRGAAEIISIVVFGGKLYMGVSMARDNLSSWPLGRSRFLFEKDQISRAEFKMLDTIEQFDINLRKYKTGVDLGAAPGGWTRILLKHGIKVIAVDPAKMDKRLNKYSNFSHYQGLSQKFFKTHPGKYDIIVNDMRMDVKSSVGIMNDAAEFLHDGGIAIMTLKLNPTRQLAEVSYAKDALSKKYNIIGARQLFHNRSEVTMVLKNRA